MKLPINVSLLRMSSSDSATFDYRITDHQCLVFCVFFHYNCHSPSLPRLHELRAESASLAIDTVIMHILVVFFPTIIRCFDLFILEIQS